MTEAVEYAMLPEHPGLLSEDYVDAEDGTTQDHCDVDETGGSGRDTGGGLGNGRVGRSG